MKKARLQVFGLHLHWPLSTLFIFLACWCTFVLFLCADKTEGTACTGSVGHTSPRTSSCYWRTMNWMSSLWRRVRQRVDQNLILLSVPWHLSRRQQFMNPRSAKSYLSPFFTFDETSLTQSCSRVHRVNQNCSSLSALLKCPSWDSFPLQIEDERKNSNFKIRRALYDKKVAENDTQHLYPLLAALSML